MFDIAFKAYVTTLIIKWHFCNTMKYWYINISIKGNGLRYFNSPDFRSLLSGGHAQPI